MLCHAAERIDGLCAELVALGLDASLAHSAGQLAKTHGLRGYDAVHLATAVGLEPDSVLPATWDVDLARAAVAEGLSVSPQPQAR